MCLFSSHVSTNAPRGHLMRTNPHCGVSGRVLQVTKTNDYDKIKHKLHQVCFKVLTLLTKFRSAETTHVTNVTSKFLRKTGPALALFRDVHTQLGRGTATEQCRDLFQ